MLLNMGLNMYNYFLNRRSISCVNTGITRFGSLMNFHTNDNPPPPPTLCQTKFISCHNK